MRLYVIHENQVHMLGQLHSSTCQAVNRMPSQKAAEFLSSITDKLVC